MGQLLRRVVLGTHEGLLAAFEKLVAPLVILRLGDLMLAAQLGDGLDLLESGHDDGQLFVGGPGSSLHGRPPCQMMKLRPLTSTLSKCPVSQGSNIEV